MVIVKFLQYSNSFNPLLDRMILYHIDSIIRLVVVVGYYILYLCLSVFE